jgi:hypothetical protein
MQKTLDGKIALIALIVFATWLFIALPLLYLPNEAHVHGELFGVKFGEWLLFAATVILAWTTWLLVNGADTTARRQLRAYVFIDGGEVILGEQPSIGATIKLKNFGSTPGYNFKTWTNIRVGASGEKIFDGRLPWRQESIIAPSAEINAPSPRVTITEQQLAAIISGSQRIYVWGEAAYIDTFGNQWKFTFLDEAGGALNTINVQGQRINLWGLIPRGYSEHQEPA